MQRLLSRNKQELKNEEKKKKERLFGKRKEGTLLA